MKRLAAILVLAISPLSAATKVLVTVVEQKSGRPVADLKAGDFTLLEDKSARRIESAEFSTDPIDVMLLLDTSLVGGMVQPVAENLIAQLQPKEQMAIVSYHSSADLIQDFTSSKQLLVQAAAKVKYGNTPRLLDALYAAIDGGFEHSTFRRVILVLTTGAEGPSRTGEREVVKLARRNGVSVYPIYAVGYEKSLFENLARQTGGASFNLRNLSKTGGQQPGPRIFEVLRSHYTLTLPGNLALGEKIRIEVNRPEKVFASALPLD
jgi:VWFA-related protein